MNPSDCFRQVRDLASGSEHWWHLRTSNLIESPFATMRLRPRMRKGTGSRTKGRLMAFTRAR